MIGFLIAMFLLYYFVSLIRYIMKGDNPDTVILRDLFLTVANSILKPSGFNDSIKKKNE